MDMGIVRGIITFLVLVLFLSIWAWSFSRNRRSEYDDAARMPLDDDSRPLSAPGNIERVEEKRS